MQQPQPKVPKHTSHQQVDFKCEEDQELVNNKDDEEAIRLALKEEQKKRKCRKMWQTIQFTVPSAMPALSSAH